MSPARNIGAYAIKIAKYISNKYSQKLINSAKISTADAIKTGSKRTIQKTAEATGDLIDQTIADRITSSSKESSQNDEDNNEMGKSTER